MSQQGEEGAWPEGKGIAWKKKTRGEGGQKNGGREALGGGGESVT